MRTPQLTHLLRPQGAALIAVLLLTMVLSAVGIVAMQNTFNSLQLSGNYRLRSQALETADSAMVFFGEVRCGNRSTNCWGRLETARTLSPGADGNVESSEDLITQGVLTPAITGETGLFSGATTDLASHEADTSAGRASFEVVMRDPVDGPPVLGSDSSYCSKLVFLGSRATYDALEVDGANAQRIQNWARPPRAASSMVGAETILDNLPCNGGGSR